MSSMQDHLESLATHLIRRHLIDNTQNEGETLSKFLQIWDQQEEVCEEQANGEDTLVMFETRAIFTMADFLKSLTPNEYYDIAQNMYNEWQEKERRKNVKQLEKLVKIREKHIMAQTMQGFQRWKQFYEMSELLLENEMMREYIQHLLDNNEMLQQERNILELQTKKRNQQQHNNIQPLRQSRRPDTSHPEQRSALRSSSRSHPLSMSLQPSDGIPIHERLHREAYKKTQQQVINDVIKQREELKDCTFKPQMSQGIPPHQFSSSLQTPQHHQSRRDRSIQREDPFLYERLSKSTKKFNPEQIMLQKEMEEMKDCTFKPETNQRSQYMVNQEDYADKEQFYDRLYKEAETKDKYKKSLQLLKDHAEVHGCTFQPEINSHRGGSVAGSARKNSCVNNTSSTEDPFSRLHQEHEVKQRSLVKIENEYDQRFKERHPFQPTRITKGKDSQLVGKRDENSQQRAARLYEQWKEREKKIELKRAELYKEEEKLCKLTLVTQSSKARRPSVDGSVSQLLTSQMSGPTDMQSQMSSSTVAHERLYTNGRDKSKKQQELRSKVYKESGYSFQPNINHEANQKYLHQRQDQTVIDRQKQFLERKEHHLREIEHQSKPNFQPHRVTKSSKLAKEWEKSDQENVNLGDKLHSKGAEIESKKERLRQELSNDQNCTFKPQLAKKTEKILRKAVQQGLDL